MNTKRLRPLKRPIPTVFYRTINEAAKPSLVICSHAQSGPFMEGDCIEQYNLLTQSGYHPNEFLTVDEIFDLCNKLNLSQDRVADWIVCMDWQDNRKNIFPMTLQDWNAELYSTAHCRTVDLISLPEFQLEFSKNSTADTIIVSENDSTTAIIRSESQLKNIMVHNKPELSNHLNLLIRKFFTDELGGLSDEQFKKVMKTNIAARKLSDYLLKFHVKNHIITTLGERHTSGDASTNSVVCINDTVIDLKDTCRPSVSPSLISKSKYLSQYKIIISEEYLSNETKPELTMP